MIRRREFLQSSARYLGAAAASFAIPPLRAFAMPAEPTPSNAIGFNQLGYLPSQSKRASVSVHSASFLLRSTRKNSIVHRGTLGSPTADAASGDTLQTADFSAFKTPGTYILELDSGQKTQPFAIGEDVYRHALQLTARSYYGQRCGCNVDLGGGYAHPACHLKAAYHASSGKDGALQNHGGWHDAGDYGRYIVNSGLSTGTLLWTWELYQRAVGKLALQIPESGGKIPDFLAEVKWNLDWMLTLQDEDGGVWHKQTSLQFCPFIMPQDDTLTSYVIGTGAAPYKSTCASADFAAVMAIAARCYSSCDSAYSQRCLVAARKAWSWCIHNPDVLFHNPRGVGTGEYGDTSSGDEMLWAAAELWRTTGEAEYLQEFTFAAGKAESIRIITPEWSSLSALAYWTYAFASQSDSRKDPAGLRSAIQDATLQTAAALLKNRNDNGYGNTLAISDYVWGSNGVVGNQAMLLLVANQFHADNNLTQAALDNLHYLLGRNCFGISWVTQLGSRPFMHPHHRPSAADHLPDPWPGLLSGGPNARPADPVAKTLPQKPPMRMYIDDEGAYSMNEIAINWNAPLVFLLAGANSL